MNRFLCFNLILTVIFSGHLAAGPKFNSAFSDGMVLQRNETVNVWGTAEPGTKITLVTSWNNGKYRTGTDAAGKWNVKIETGDAGGPYTMSLSSGKDRITISDILIGEVWICSGQSNMAMKLKGNPGQPVSGSLENIMYADKYEDRIRYFDIALRGSDTLCMELPSAVWKKCMSVTVSDFSALAYYFAKNLTEALDVPVGIIVNAWGSSKIEAWLDDASLHKLGEISPDPEGTMEQHKKGHIFNALVYPLAGFTARGFLWYQGESNKTEPEKYVLQLQEMVSRWRTLWNAPEMPFYQVQIAPFAYQDANDDTAPAFMEAQLKAASLIPQCNIVPTTDIGDDWCIHPKAKDIAGFRLAHMALKETYGHYDDAIPATGPVLKKHIWKENKLKIYFDQPLSALPEGVEGLELEYADGSEVSISGRVAPRDSSVIIECPDRSEVKYVRYAYRNVSPANLKNIYGFPVFPFRKHVEQ